LPHGTFGQFDTELLADQFHHGATGPQGVRDTQLLWRMVVDALLDALGLQVGEKASRTERPTGATAGKGIQTLGGVGCPPTAEGLVADTQQVREFTFGVAQLQAP
jgi:hypothetical protein